MNKLDINKNFLNWFLDLVEMNLQNKIAKMRNDDFDCVVIEFSTQINKQYRIDLADKNIIRENLFANEGYLKILYNYKSSSTAYFKDMEEYLSIILLNSCWIVFVNYNYKNDDLTYFSFTDINSSCKTIENLIDDVIFVLKFLSEKYFIIN